MLSVCKYRLNRLKGVNAAWEFNFIVTFISNVLYKCSKPVTKRKSPAILPRTCGVGAEGFEPPTLCL